MLRLGLKNGAERGTRTPTPRLRAADFKSAASASSAIPAHHNQYRTSGTEQKSAAWQCTPGVARDPYELRYFVSKSRGYPSTPLRFAAGFRLRTPAQLRPRSRPQSALKILRLRCASLRDFCCGLPLSFALAHARRAPSTYAVLVPCRLREHIAQSFFFLCFKMTCNTFLLRA